MTSTALLLQAVQTSEGRPTNVASQGLISAGVYPAELQRMRISADRAARVPAMGATEGLISAELFPAELQRLTHQAPASPALQVMTLNAVHGVSQAIS